MARNGKNVKGIKGGDAASQGIRTFEDAARASNEAAGKLRGLADLGRTPSPKVMRAIGGPKVWAALSATRCQPT